jgi:hypothetical protein
MTISARQRRRNRERLLAIPAGDQRVIAALKMTFGEAKWAKMTPGERSRLVSEASRPAPPTARPSRSGEGARLVARDTGGMVTFPDEPPDPVTGGYTLDAGLDIGGRPRRITVYPPPPADVAMLERQHDAEVARAQDAAQIEHEHFERVLAARAAVRVHEAAHEQWERVCQHLRDEHETRRYVDHDGAPELVLPPEPTLALSDAAVGAPDRISGVVPFYVYERVDRYEAALAGERTPDPASPYQHEGTAAGDAETRQLRTMRQRLRDAVRRR